MKPTLRTAFRPRGFVIAAVVLVIHWVVYAAATLTAQVTPSEVKRALTDKLEQLAALVQQLPETPTPASAPTMVTTDEDLQAALDKGGTIELQARGTFTGSFTVRWSGTRINAHNARLIGTSTSRPALYIPPDVDDVWVSDLEVTSASVDSAIQVGDNGPTQIREAQQPERIIFTNVRVPTHRGKRAIAWHASGTVIDSAFLDSYSAAGVESQAFWLGNSCGPLLLWRVELVGGSENFLSGGDTNKMGCVPSVVVLDTVTASKPLAWFKVVPVKNLIECKACRAFILRNSTLKTNWVSGQEGTAIVLTPRNGAYVQDVLIDNVTVEDVPLGIQILGKDSATVTPEATSGIIVRNSRFTISKARNGGRGAFMLVTGGTLDVTVENTDVTLDGTSLVVADGPVPQGPFTMRGSRAGMGSYLIAAPGSNWGNPVTGTYVGREFAAILEGNTLTPGAGMSSTGLAAVKRNFPNNTFLPKP